MAKKLGHKEPQQISRRRFLEAAALGAAGFQHAGVVGKQRAPLQMAAMTEKWFPSRWGAGDQAGASNLMTSQKVLEATSLIRVGKVHSLDESTKRACPSSERAAGT